MRRGLDVTDPRDLRGEGLAADLVLLPADETNGLEFDAVVVVEPALIAAVGGDPVGDGPPPATTRGLAHPVCGPDPTHPSALGRPRLALPVDLTEATRRWPLKRF